MNSTFRFFATLIGVCMAMAIVVKMNNEMGFILLCVIAFVMIPIWTSFYLLEIDPDKKQYLDATVVMGRKFGRPNPYESIEDIFIKPQGYTQNFHSRSGAVFENKSVKFDGYLKFSDGKKIFLISDEEKEDLKKKLKPFAEQLQTTIREVTPS